MLTAKEKHERKLKALKQLNDEKLLAAKKKKARAKTELSKRLVLHEEIRENWKAEHARQLELLNARIAEHLKNKLPAPGQAELPTPPEVLDTTVEQIPPEEDLSCFPDGMIPRTEQLTPTGKTHG